MSVLCGVLGSAGCQVPVSLGIGVKGRGRGPKLILWGGIANPFGLIQALLLVSLGGGGAADRFS